MRAVIQRVKNSQVAADDKIIGEIGKGILVLLGISLEDQEEDADYLVSKIVNLRIFEDVSGKMNYSCLEIKGEILVISQFTLYADCRKGRRPSFSKAAQPYNAESLYNYFIKVLKNFPLIVKEGKFQAQMQVYLCNDGPVTLILDSRGM